jgi:hypothetical protein
MRLHALILEGDAWGNIVNVSRHDGDNPLRLAEEIDAALDKYGLATIVRASCA